MADLFRLLQVLGERIASKNDSGSTTQTDEEDPVEARFRCVIPNLLRGYVDPSKANERELTAILKLLSHTAKKYPGVFYHGKAHAILPVLGRIVPFFAEPGFGGRHGVLFETMAALLSLLRTGDHDIYCQFYLDSLLVVEDLLSIASFYATKSNLALPTMLSITCFSESFSRICSSSSPAPFCDLPACWKPPDGPGILVDVTGEQRWLPFAHWMLKLLSRCLAESSLHVEGLITSSFMSKACTLLCYGDGELQRVCFEFVRIATSVVDAEIIPAEKLILTIVCILSHKGESVLPSKYCIVRVMEFSVVRSLLCKGYTLAVSIRMESAYF